MAVMVRIHPLLICLLSALPAGGAADGLPVVTHYSLDLQFALREQQVRSVATLTVRNMTPTPHGRLRFLLYRLFTVEHVYDRAGAPMPYSQSVTALRDEPSLQANAVVVDLPAPLAPNDSTNITLTYRGFMFGYPEVMAYVKDRIDEDYSLLRPDAFAFPVLAEPTFASVLAAGAGKFTYDITASVPHGYTVACGGLLVNSRVTPDSATYVFHSKIPTWRMDVAAAKFSVVRSPVDRLVVYHLPEDSTGARRVLKASRDVIQFYAISFGQPRRFQGYTIIEIPDGWGSQASDYYFLQTAASFKDSSRIGEVYHEIGHSWNAAPSPDVQRCRWFDEAFASFYESLATRHFSGQSAFEKEMEQSRDIFVRWGNRDPQVFDTPIAEYGKYELGRHSYTKGAWSLYVLYSLVGEKTFADIIRTMLTDSEGRTISFGDFEALCERVAGRSLRTFFQEWIYGTESSHLLADRVPIAAIVARYSH
jgi:Peptidase family M1 domain